MTFPQRLIVIRHTLRIRPPPALYDRLGDFTAKGIPEAALFALNDAAKFDAFFKAIASEKISARTTSSAAMFMLVNTFARAPRFASWTVNWYSCSLWYPTGA